MKKYTTLVWVTDSRGRTLGSGTGISLGDGSVLTNHHVVRNATQVWVRFADGRRDQVQITRVDQRRDLALIKSSFVDQPAAQFGDSRILRAAESLLAVGYPRSEAIGTEDATVTRGIFSGLREADGVWHVQTDTPVNPGNSGGPLADSQGRVIGVVRHTVRNSVGLNFAVASDEVQAFLQSPASIDDQSSQVDPTASIGPPTRVANPTRPPPTRVANPIRPPPTPPAPQPTTSAPTPADISVRSFYAAIGARDFRAAWNLLGPTFREKNQYDSWVRGFEATRGVQVNHLRTVSQASDAATVEFTITATDAAGASTITKTFEGTWSVKRVDGAWRLDVPSIKQVN